MQITSESFVITMCVVALLAVVAVPVLWDWWPWRKTGRAATVLLATVLALFSGGALINAQGDFFPTWTSLVGGDSSGLASGSNGVVGDIGQRHGRELIQRELRRYAGLTRHGNGVVVREDFAGAKSRISRPGAVYLPAAYFDRASQNVEFPVIELLSGSPGDPAGELRNLRIAQYLDQEIHADRMPPTIAVIPSTNPSALQDDECVNAVGGQADDTYLTTDIRADMLRDFRVLSDRQDWSLVGYSTGGYCAVNLTVRHPEYYSAAVSFSGYFYPITDYTTGDLYRRNRQVKAANSPLLTLNRDTTAGREQPATAFFLTAGSLEHGPPGQMRTLLSELRAPASGMGVLVPNGGHDWGPWRQELPVALDWVGRHFGGALAPALIPDHGETIIHASAVGPKLLASHASGKPVPKRGPKAVLRRVLARRGSPVVPTTPPIGQVTPTALRGHRA